MRGHGFRRLLIKANNVCFGCGFESSNWVRGANYRSAHDDRTSGYSEVQIPPEPHTKANRSIKLTHTEAQRHIRDAKQKTGMFVLVRTEALHVAGYATLCGNGFLTLVHRHLL